MKKRLLCTCALIAFACKQSPKDARQELAKLNVPFTADEFVMRCARGPTTLIDTFLVAGADPNVVVVEGQETVTPLMAAAVAGRIDIAKQLCKAGAEVDVRTGKRGAALDVAAGNCQHPEMVAFLLENGAKPSDRSVFAAIEHSGYRQSECGLAGLDLLLKAGANANQRGRKDLTPLIIAADHNDAEAVRILLQHGADPNLQGGEYGFSALRIAVMSAMNVGRPDTLEVVKALLAAKADPNQRDRYGSILSGLGPSPALEPIRQELLRAGARR